MKYILVLLCGFIALLEPVFAARLAIVIDDFGYRQKNEAQVIEFSEKITVAVLPHSPNAQRIAEQAHQHGNEVIIHLPMAPVSKQPLEKDTLFPNMDQSEVARIMHDAMERVPYAIGINNHMGSLMTADLAGMEKVMQVLADHSFFFLDSRTTGKSKVAVAAAPFYVTTLTRDVFLDDSMNEADITRQFDEAVRLARKNGTAIAIGHPYNQTVNVLRQKLVNLPDDIELVTLSSLLPPEKNLNLAELMQIIQTRAEHLLFEILIQKESLK